MIIIKDNFLHLPNVVREWALAQEYYDAQQMSVMYGERTEWPGTRTTSIVDLDKSYADYCLGMLSNTIMRMTGRGNISINSYFQITSEKDGCSWVHQDNNVDFAAVLYLTPNPPPDSGTIIYKCNDHDAWLKLMDTREGITATRQINEAERIDLYDTLFTPVDTLTNVYNRLVIYPGDLFHKSNKYFGKDINNSRLTQVFFVSFDK